MNFRPNSLPSSSQPDYVPSHLVVSSVTLYHAAVVDIRPRRTVHSVDALPCLVLNPDPLAKGSGQVDCRAVHYGVCVPILLQFEPAHQVLTETRASLETDLHTLVNKFVAADRAAQQQQPQSPLSSPSLPMLALATASAASSAGPGSPPAQAVSRPMAASSILSAVEKFERKTMQAGNRPQGNRSPTIQLQKAKRDSSPGPIKSVLPSTTNTLTMPTKTQPAVTTEAVSPVSPTAPATSPTTPTKYDSCTWPSFKRSSVSAAETLTKGTAGVITIADRSTTTVVSGNTAIASNKLVEGQKKELEVKSTPSLAAAVQTGKAVAVASTPAIAVQTVKQSDKTKKPEEKQPAMKSRGQKKVEKVSKKVRISDKKESVDVKKIESVADNLKSTVGETAPTATVTTTVTAKSENDRKVVGKSSTVPTISSKKSAKSKLLEEELDKMMAVNNQVQVLITDVEAMPGNIGKDLGSSSSGVQPVLQMSPPMSNELEMQPNNNNKPFTNGNENKDKDSAKYIEQYILSPVDFAKTRFQRSSTTAMVTETKSRFENGQIHNPSRDRWRPEWLPSPTLLSAVTSGDPVAEANLVQAAVDVLKRDSRQQRLNQRKASSPEPTIPHPKLTTTQKQHIRERSLSPTGYASGAHVPIRPFLTKGSVAERVLIFEKCPTAVVEREVREKVFAKHPSVGLGLTSTAVDGSKSQNVIKDKEDKSKNVISPPTSRSLGSLQRLTNKSCAQSAQIPHFHFPNGRPTLARDSEASLQRVATAFSNLESGRAYKEQFGTIAKACDLPLYWKIPLFLAAGGEKKGYVTSEVFLEFWKRILSSCHDDASKFVKILGKSSRNYLLPEDFTPLIQDVVNTHPGLTFLKEAIEFHSRYVHTVIARIYYCVNRSWTGRITAPELRKNNFLQIVSLLEEEDDINQITEYFSYEHFYVIYCKFWELDKDHDLYIDKSDLSRHNDHAISGRMIDRIFSGAVTRGRAQKEQKMSYTEFVWFLMSEEDKRHPTSIEYWFRCMDLDGDGYLSMYELEYFYEEQLKRMEALGIETLPFKDCLCQMLDMIRPKTPGMVSLSDLKHCRMTSIFYDTFFNLEKYLDHEQRDPFASQRTHDVEGGIEMSDWDRYAAEEYEFLVAEEGANDQPDDIVYEDEEDELSPNLDKLAMANVDPRRNLDLEEDYGDYADYAESDDYQY